MSKEEKRKLWKNINMALTFAWLVMVPVAVLTGWIYSLAFISAASIYANDNPDLVEEALKYLRDNIE